jgi:uncharacterized RmlC-like cupin family protein
MSYPERKYHGDTGEVSATYRPVTQEPELLIGPVAKVHYLATGASTGGQFGLYRWEMGPQPAGAGTHFHKTISESFFVLSGAVRVFDGERWKDGAPGDFFYVPEGGLHAFCNESGEPASMLILFVPGAPREPYFETLAEVAAGRKQLSAEEMAEHYLRHDTYMV